MAKHYLGMKMQGLLGIAYSTDLEIGSLEHDPGLVHIDIPHFDMEGSKMQFNIHQMSILSLIVSYMRKNPFNSSPDCTQDSL